MKLWFAVGLLTVVAPLSQAFGQGYPPGEAASHMTVPAGCEVTLFASEPMVRQPVCIEFDDRGRLWVVQYLQYPNPAGLTRVKVDRYSRTEYDHLPDPPPKGVKGADRITILEDTNGDGVPDKSKDFVSGLNLASGIAFGHGGVYVMNPPYLLFYPDKNRDDVPDGDPEVLLTGFGFQDAHSVANSLTFGPDGWLYGCQGSTVTSNIRGVEFQQGVWRYHPLTKKFELFCEGGGNSWGLDFDPHGNLLYTTNFGGFVMLHGVQGAYYWKSFGKHGPLHNPYTYGYIDHVPHANFQGGHVTDGGIVYAGDNLPASFRGKYIANDLLGHAVRWSGLTRVGSSFHSAHEGELLRANDTWFAPSDLTMGPDGAVYVADWSDQRTAHPDPDADWDRSNGRVYRIAAKGSKFTPGPDYSKLSADQLVPMLAKPDNWVSRKARRELMNRRDPEVVDKLRQIVENSANPQHALEALWALYVSGGFNDELAGKLLSSDNPDIRRWTVRFLGDAEQVTPELAKRLADVAAHDGDADVRSQLASTAKRLPAADGLPIVRAIALRNLDGKDQHIPLLLWWAVERHAIDARDEVLATFKSAEVWRSPLAKDAILGRLTRRYAAEGTTDGMNACATLLAAAPSDADKRELLASLDQGLSERSVKDATASNAVIPDALAAQLKSLWSEDTTDLHSIRVLSRLGQTEGQAQAWSIAVSAKYPPALRVPLVETMAEFGKPDKTAKTLLDMARARGEAEPVRMAALASLARYEDDAIPAAIVEAYGSLPAAMHPRAIDLLLGRPKWAAKLLDAIDAGKVKPTDVTIEQLQRISDYKDKTLDARVEKRWGRITGGTPEEKLAEVRRFNNDLRAAPGNPAAGREIFKNTCAVCHKLFDDGASVGPDLTHANRSDRNFLLVSIVDPSAVARAEYLNYLVKTTDGRVLSGLLVEQTPAAVTLLAAKGERTTIPRDKVQVLKESPVSLMPEGLLSAMKPQQLRDLFSYLQSNNGK
jgi:putative membrane-bound dehydrogenase-like protein